MRATRTSTTAMLATIALAFLTPVVHAQGPFENIEQKYGRGFDPTKIYSGGDVDQVNTFNGNLTLSIPIGQRYSTGGGFSYGFQLTYNSTFWDYDTRNDPDRPPPCSFPNDVPVGGQSVRAFPGLSFNAGLGWSLSPGQLWGPQPSVPDDQKPPRPVPNQDRRWLYIAPDGSQHQFYSQLHAGASGADPDPGVSYTWDGSTLRLQGYDGDNNVAIEFPDGSVHHFELVDPANPATKEYRLNLIQDRLNALDPMNGNYLRVDYVPNATNPDINDWVFTDSLGRTQNVVFRTAPPYTTDMSFNEQIPSRPVVDSIVLRAFGDPEATAMYKLMYDPVSISTDSKSKHPSVPATMTVLVLRDVILADPDDGGPLGSLAYHADYDIGITGIDSGRLLQLTLPTGDRVSWVYGSYAFPKREAAQCVLPGQTCEDPMSDNVGVVERRVEARTTDSAGNPVYQDNGLWTYVQKPFEQFGYQKTDASCRAVVTTQTIVTNPLGNATTEVDNDYQTVHYYSVLNTSYPPPADIGITIPADYGLPYTRNTLVGGESDPHFLSTQQYDENGQLARTTYVRYAMDTDLPGEAQRNNRRLVSTRTVFHDDGGQYTETTMDGYDGLGHHRRSTSKHSFGNQRTTFTGYNPGRGTFCGVTNNVNAGPYQQADFFCDNSSAPFVPPSPTEAWLVGLFDLQDISHSTTQDTYSCFDGDTGQLKARRVRQGSQAAADVLTAFDYDSDGNVVGERTYGGDTQPLPGGVDFSYTTSGGCTLLGALPSHPAYQLQRSYQFGSLAKEGFVDSCKCPGGNCATSLANEDQGLVLLTTDLTIDENTGLATQSRDSAGFAVDYSYDRLGRLTEADPAQSAPLRYAYNSDFPLQVTETRGNAATLTERLLEFGGMGRVVRQRTRVPNPNNPSNDLYVEQLTEYDQLGRVLTQSEQAANPRACGSLANPGPCTFFTYDAFGRVKETRAPDGSLATNVYTGVRRIARTVVVDGSPSTTTETYDAHGRLVRVDEPSGPGGALTGTVYDYDHANRVTSVRIGSSNQTRTFTYDGRGFLTSESHPEIGLSGNGTMVYGGYDALGNAGSRSIAGGPTLSYAYDRAGRMTQLRGTDGELIKELFYAPQSVNAPDASEGKLVMAKRHNLIADPADASQTKDVVITETYTYNGDDGRVSAIRARSSLGLSSIQTYEYDNLGQIDAVHYPLCDRPPCGLVGSGRRIVNRFNDGVLIGVDESDSSHTYPFADSISYHENGLLKDIAHRNGVIDAQTSDVNGMLRPASLTTSLNGTPLWQSGAYSYDGVGNITAIGANDYDYDPVSRLKRGKIDIPGPSDPEQFVAYDAFGNITSLTTDGSSEPISVDPATNRLNMLGTCYDAAGNVTQWSAVPGATPGTCTPNTGYRYEWDDLNRMTRIQATGVNSAFLYDSSDNRIASFDYLMNDLRWSPRGPEDKVLTDFRWNRVDNTVEYEKDYIYRGNALLSSVHGDVLDPSHEESQYHLDHLGSTRLVTQGTGTVEEQGQVLGEYHYFPFGSIAYQMDSGERFLFTGHERDLNCLEATCGEGSERDDLDYMLARHYSPVLGRFLAIDPAGARIGRATLYEYARNNPVQLVDPDGLKAQFSASLPGFDRLSQKVVFEYKLSLASTSERRHTAAESGTFIGEVALDLSEKAMPIAAILKTIGSFGLSAYMSVDHEGRGIQLDVSYIDPDSGITHEEVQSEISDRLYQNLNKDGFFAKTHPDGFTFVGLAQLKKAQKIINDTINELDTSDEVKKLLRNDYNLLKYARGASFAASSKIPEARYFIPSDETFSLNRDGAPLD